MELKQQTPLKSIPRTTHKAVSRKQPGLFLTETSNPVRDGYTNRELMVELLETKEQTYYHFYFCF